MSQHVISDNNVSGPATSSAADRHELMHWQSGLVEALEAKDGARVATYYADDAVLITPGRTPLEGREAIAQMFEQDMRDVGFSLHLADQRTEMSSAGDMGYTRGTFRASFTNSQTRNIESIGGDYVQVFRRQHDGRWNVVQDIASPGLAPRI